MAYRAFKGAGHQYLRFAGASQAVKASGPCRVCFDFDLQAAAQRFPTEYRSRKFVRIDLFDLAESADTGDCIWCAILWRAGTELGGKLPPVNRSGYVLVHAVPGSPAYFSWEGGKGRISGHIFRANKAVGSSPAALKLTSAIGTVKEIATDINSEACMETVCGWVEECLREHDRCPHPNNVPPRRLLDIGVNPDHRDWSQLRLNDNPDGGRPYAALSHCWGLTKPFTTTKETLSSRLSSISWESLPLTFRDALMVTRRLGLRYLWIDSLCIVQDDEIDWHREAENMGQIYENSYVTIAAALAAGDEIGFLHNSPERINYASAFLDLADFDVSEGAVKVRLTHDVRTQSSPDILATRGWVLQESLLPPRLLTFSVTATFECRTASKCECGVSRLADPFCGDTRAWLIDRSDYIAMLQTPNISHSERYQYWLDVVVGRYGSRAFSKPSDRLVALSALATKYAFSLNDTYLAGLWQRNLATDLAWQSSRSRYDPGDPLSVNPAAPSWSWASLDGPVITSSLGSDRTIKSETIQFLSMEEHDTTDQLSGSHCLRLEGPICPARLLLGHSLTSARLLPPTSPLAQRDISKGGRLLSALSRDIPSLQLTTSQRPEVPVYELLPTLDTYLVERSFRRQDGSFVVTAGRPSAGRLEQQAPLDAAVYCLYLIERIVSSEANSIRNVSSEIYLLLLEALPEHNAFRRIGQLEIELHVLKQHSWLYETTYLAEIKLF